MHVTRTKAALTGSALLASAVLAGALAGGTATAASSGRHTHGHLNPLNNSGVVGNADVHIAHRRLNIDIDAHGLAKNLPHAQHIHFGAQARNECPSVADDTNGDFHLTTGEGVGAYGPVRVSLTKSGET